MVSTKIFVGIDPGKEGAITKIFPDGNVEVIPLHQIGGEYDIIRIQSEFQVLSMTNCHVVLEDVKALQRPYDRGNWSLSGCKSMLATLLIVYQIPHTLVSPKVWQKEMWQGVKEMRGPSTTVKRKDGVTYSKKGSMLTKEMSTVAANRLFPNADLRSPYRKTDRATKDHDGTVDSLLMAGYAQRNFK